MYSPGDAAEQVVRMSLERAKFALKITSSTAKNLAAALYTVLKDQKETRGRAHIETMPREKRPTTVYITKRGGAPEFARQAKGCGVLYAPIPVKKDGSIIDILVSEDGVVRANRVVEKFNLTVVDTASAKGDIQKSHERHSDKPAAPEQAAPEKNQDDKLLNELMEKSVQKEKAEPEHPAVEKTDSFTPAAEKSHPFTPIFESNSKSARGTSDGPEKSSVHQELWDIQAQRKKGAEVTRAEEPSTSKEPAQKTTRRQPPKPKKKPKSKERQMFMDDLNDLFEQQPQKEIVLQKPEGQEKRPKRQRWQIREEKQRKEAYASLDKILGVFAEGNDNMEAYLDVQSRSPLHSAHNTLLTGVQCPQAQCMGGYKERIAQGIEILGEEKKLPIIILESDKTHRGDDGSIGQNFCAREIYDTSQTSAQGQYQPRVIYDDRLLLKGLIASSPVQIWAIDELPQERGTVFSGEQSVILAKKGMDAPDIFRCVSLRTANVQLVRSNEGYSREADGYKAYVVGYMLCKRYSIETKSHNIGRSSSVFRGQDLREGVPAALSDTRGTFKSLSGRMARAIGLTRDTEQKEPER